MNAIGPVPSKRGYSLLEVMIASAVGTAVTIVVMTTFLWTGRQSNLCAKIAWSQTEAMRTSGKIEAYVRNASSISAIDQNLGNWVEFRFPNGETSRFTYYNLPNSPRDGKLYLQRTNTVETIVARGLTKITSTNGYSMPMFTKVNDRAVRISYRVAEPTPTGARASDDELYASSMRFAVCLRNVPE
jgi:hypothetical protein